LMQNYYKNFTPINNSVPSSDRLAKAAAAMPAATSALTTPVSTAVSIVTQITNNSPGIATKAIPSGI
jgi:hypothetical protein